MSELAKGYDYEGAMRFPLFPGAHEIAWRYMFDWVIAGEALRGAPGDLVLEFGAGPCWASELLNRLGYRTVGLDINPEILRFARDRMNLDRRLTPRWASYVAGDGQRLPFADSTFDGVICLNALHHMLNYAATLSELRRVLKPGGRAVFSEPGSRHSASPEAQLAVKEYGFVERDVVLEEIHRIASQVGFERMILKPYVYPHMVELDYDQLDSFRENRPPTTYLRAEQIALFAESIHPIFALTLPGDRPVTSARPAVLRAEIRVGALPEIVHAGQVLTAAVSMRNTGDTCWLSAPREVGGFVTLGMKLCTRDGRMLSDVLGRTHLGHDVLPGEEARVHATVRLPEILAPGEYVLRFDMVDELITWFEHRGSSVTEHCFCVGSPCLESARDDVQPAAVRDLPEIRGAEQCPPPKGRSMPRRSANSLYRLIRSLAQSYYECTLPKDGG